MNNTKHLPKENITAVILAGGRARRMEGQDKGLLKIHSRTLIEYVINAIKPQVKTILINANRNQPQYRDYGYTVIEDNIGKFYGPLAGIASALEKAKTDYVVAVPCDCPLLPATLVSRLYSALQSNNGELSVAHDGQRLQPVFALLRKELLPSLLAYLEGGERRVDAWYGQHNPTIVDFSDTSDSFININSCDDIKEVEYLLASKENNSPAGN